MFLNQFDLPEFQQEVREAKSAKQLFDLWDGVCKMYERGQISKYELEEMRDIIWPQMRSLVSLQGMIDGSFAARLTERERLAS